MPLVSIANRCGLRVRVSRTHPSPGPSLKLTRRREIQGVSGARTRTTLRDSARETELEAESSLVRAPTRWGRPIGDASGSSDDMLPGWARDRQIFRPQTYTVVRRPDRTSARGGARWKIHSALFAIIPMYTGRDRDTYSAYFDGKRAVKTSSYVHLLLLVSLTGGHSVTHGVHDSKTHLFNREYSDFRCTSRYEGLVLFKKFYYN